MLIDWLTNGLLLSFYVGWELGRRWNLEGWMCSWFILTRNIEKICSIRNKLNIYFLNNKISLIFAIVYILFTIQCKIQYTYLYNLIFKNINWFQCSNCSWLTNTCYFFIVFSLMCTRPLYSVEAHQRH